MSSELLDRVDTLNRLTGTTIERKVAHREGVWHRTVNFLVIDPRNKTVLFQNKRNKPVDENFFVQINGGHLTAGEEPEDGLREFREELGIDVSPSKFKFVGIVPTCVDLSPDFLLREFMYYYIVEVPNLRTRLISNFDNTLAEAEAFVECGIEAGFRMLVSGETASIPGANITVANVQKIVLTPSHFRNFTDDNLYARIFSLLARHSKDPSSNMPL